MNATCDLAFWFKMMNLKYGDLQIKAICNYKGQDSNVRTLPNSHFKMMVRIYTSML